MRKHVIATCILILPGFVAAAQQYALIDKSLSQPIKYADKITAQDIRQKLLPIEARFLPELVKALTAIRQDLDNESRHIPAKNFHFGCTRINGLVATLKTETRFNYVIQSDCDALKAQFLICDAKFKNSTNSFILGAWIKYLSANLNRKP